ncbi:MAG: septal ring lytic transglycosylase RlpA family protein [Bacillota bacterium]
MKENQCLYYTLACILLISAILYYRQPVPVYEATVNQDREIYTEAAAAHDAADLLQEQEFSSAPACIFASPYAPEQEEGTVLDLQVVTEEIPFNTIRREDNTLDKGRILTLQEGRKGIRELVFRVVYAGGKEIYRELVTETVLTKPLDTVVAVGTKPRPQLPVASREKADFSYREEGIASWYGAEFQGSRTTSGELYNKHAFTAAHRTLPFNTLVKVTYLRTGKEVVVRINDRGPHVKGRIIDLSRAAAEEIGLKPHGVGKVRIEAVE